MQNKKTKAYKNKLNYTKELIKAHYKQVNLMLHDVNDADIIEYLSTLPNKSGYLKELIRRDMKK